MTTIMTIKRTNMNDLVVVEKIAGWEKLKALVLDSVSSQSQKGCTTWSWTSSCLAASDAN
jgi:hypothetical protein